MNHELGSKLKYMQFFFVWNSYRTLLPIQYPPHALALGSIYVAALLASFEQPTEESEHGCKTNQQIASGLSEHGDWEEKFHIQVEDLEGMAAPHANKDYSSLPNRLCAHNARFVDPRNSEH